MSDAALGKIAFNAFRKAMGVTVQDSDWDMLEPVQQSFWIAAAKAVIEASR